METTAFTRKSNGIMRVLTSEVGVVDPIQTRLANKPLQISNFNAIWDTGATGSVITNKVVQQMNLVPTGMANVFTANGQCQVNTYLIDLILPNKVQITDLVVTEGTITNTEDLLIGMDVMNLGDFAISNYKGKTTFSFRVPSTEDTDYVEQINKLNKTGRNNLCPCNSGKKYKHCHGK